MARLLKRLRLSVAVFFALGALVWAQPLRPTAAATPVTTPCHGGGGVADPGPCSGLPGSTIVIFVHDEKRGPYTALQFTTSGSGVGAKLPNVTLSGSGAQLTATVPAQLCSAGSRSVWQVALVSPAGPLPIGTFTVVGCPQGAAPATAARVPGPAATIVLPNVCSSTSQSVGIIGPCTLRPNLYDALEMRQPANVPRSVSFHATGSGAAVGGDIAVKHAGNGAVYNYAFLVPPSLCVPATHTYTVSVTSTSGVNEGVVGILTVDCSGSGSTASAPAAAAAKPCHGGGGVADPGPCFGLPGSKITVFVHDQKRGPYTALRFTTAGSAIGAKVADVPLSGSGDQLTAPVPAQLCTAGSRSVWEVNLVAPSGALPIGTFTIVGCPP
jgi:hypothetical protein